MMMRTIGGIALGFALFFPGIVFLRWFYVSLFGFYDEITVTDGCLVMIIVLLSVQLVRSGALRQSSRSRNPRAADDEHSHLRLAGPTARRERELRQDSTTTPSRRSRRR